MTTIQKIRALAEEHARREIYAILRGRKADANLRTEDDEVTIARGDVLTDELLARVPSVDDFERVQVADHSAQDAVFSAIDRYHEVVPHRSQDLRAWATQLLREEDPDVTSITINRKRGPRT